jgi:hypothetical protein
MQTGKLTLSSFAPVSRMISDHFFASAGKNDGRQVLLWIVRKLGKEPDESERAVERCQDRVAVGSDDDYLDGPAGHASACAAQAIVLNAIAARKLRSFI